MLIFLVILFLIIACIGKLINTYPMQAELDRINKSRNMWQTIAINQFYDIPPDCCVQCVCIYGGCPIESDSLQPLQNKDNLARYFRADYCPATLSDKVKAFK